MSKLLQCKIDVSKIDKSLLFKGKKGTYLDLLIWINDKPDQYGNECSIEQKVKMGEKKNYIGNGKFYVPKPVQVIDANDQSPESSDLPF
jgi:hypothetical protein